MLTNKSWDLPTTIWTMWYMGGLFATTMWPMEEPPVTDPNKITEIYYQPTTVEHVWRDYASTNF
jgi:hypothetical protein